MKKIIIIIFSGIFICSCQSSAIDFNKTNIMQLSSSCDKDLPCKLNRNINKIAIVIPNNRDINYQNENKSVIETNVSSILQSLNYSVISESSYSIVYENIETNNSALTSTPQSGISNTGEVINVDAILRLWIPLYEESKNESGESYISQMHLSARLIDATTGETLWEATNAFKINLATVFFGLPFYMLDGGYQHLTALSLTILDSLPPGET